MSKSNLSAIFGDSSDSEPEDEGAQLLSSVAAGAPRGAPPGAPRGGDEGRRRARRVDFSDDSDSTRTTTT